MKLVWPLIILCSALLAGLVNFVLPDLPGRPFVLFWFLSVCPGMMLVRFLHLKEPVAEWSLAVALSLAVDTLVASLQMYAGHWSPPLTLLIVIGICVAGVLVHFRQIRLRKA